MPRKKQEMKEEKTTFEFEELKKTLDGYKKEKKEKRKRKAVFIERLLAFLIDTAIVSIVCSMIALPFINSNNLTELQDEQNKIMTEVQEIYSDSNLKRDEVVDKVMSKTNDLGTVMYELSRAEGVASLIIIIAELLYFVVFQLYNNGQTLGKKLLKIRVVSTNDNQLTSNQLLFRAFIINSILYNIIEFAFMIFANKYVYLPTVLVFNFIQNILILICGFMVMFRKDGKGLHDVICKTEVIKE